jgi:hypothetical protein
VALLGIHLSPIALSATLVVATSFNPDAPAMEPPTAPSSEDGVSVEPHEAVRRSLACLRTAESGALRLAVSVSGCFGGTGSRIELIWTPHEARLTASASDVPTSRLYGDRSLSRLEAVALTSTIVDVVGEREVPNGTSSTNKYSAWLQWQCDESEWQEISTETNEADGHSIRALLGREAAADLAFEEGFRHALVLFDVAEAVSIGSATSR